MVRPRIFGHLAVCTHRNFPAQYVFVRVISVVVRCGAKLNDLLPV